ncbi:MAG: SCP-like extracellular [Chloroflexi bacterium OLB13]|nr:MAG: SCP-like extracellular [Chloroflexi bacterium OLB13]
MRRMKRARVFFALLLLAAVILMPARAQDVVSDLLGRINGLRGSLGLPGYTLNSALSAAALNQAQYMVSTGQITHTQANGSTPTTRAAAAGYGGSWVSENIYAGSIATTNDAWVFWLNSPIHYRGMTNPNYQEIGIASASSDWGRSFVLVFGRVGGTPLVSAGSSGGNSGSQSSAPPSFVVGLDSFGNIMHEIQPEQTLGDILLTYGYTWDDTDEMLALNHLTRDDIRLLQVGAIFLVPPKDGTYTPTPLPEGWPTSTPEPDDFVATAIAEAASNATAAALTPTITLMPTSTPEPAQSPSPRPFDTPTVSANNVSVARIATSAGVPAFLVMTMTPTTGMEPTASPTTDSTEIAQVSSPPPAAPALVEQVSVQPPSESPWLIIALIGQAVVIAAGAVIFFLSRRRR